MQDEPQVQEEVTESGEDRLAALEAERDDAIDRWKRAAADFDNFKKRAAREREEYVAFANERLVTDLLPILDDLERALAAVGEHEEATVEEGVRLVHRSLESLLERNGVRVIETNGKFDPHVHEALLSQPSTSCRRATRSATASCVRHGS